MPERKPPLSTELMASAFLLPLWIPHVWKEPELFLFLNAESKTSQDSWASAGHSIAFADRWTLGLAELVRDKRLASVAREVRTPAFLLSELQLHQRAIWATPGCEGTSGASVPRK